MFSIKVATGKHHNDHSEKVQTWAQSANRKTTFTFRHYPNYNTVVGMFSTSVQNTWRQWYNFLQRPTSWLITGSILGVLLHYLLPYTVEEGCFHSKYSNWPWKYQDLYRISAKITPSVWGFAWQIFVTCIRAFKVPTLSTETPVVCMFYYKPR